MLAVVVNVVLGLAVALAAGRTVGQTATSGTSTQPAPVAATIPPVTLTTKGLPGGADSEQELAAWIEEELAKLDQHIEGTPAEDTVRRHLQAANVILAYQAEPYVSRLIFGGSVPQDVVELRSTVESARRRIAQANDILATLISEGDEAPLPQLSKLRDCSKELSAFADALTFAWDDSQTEESVLAKRSAASAVAALVEDRRSQVAQAASLYQAVLFDAIEYDDRALEGLDPALQPVIGEHPQFGLGARMLRCRILAQKDQFVAAWLLLLRMEEQIPQWFAASEQQQDAIHAVILTRLAITRQWEQSSRTDNAASASGIWFEETKNRILQTLSVPESDTISVTRFRNAIPMLFESGPEPVQGNGANG